jgi:hypothetical protein
LNKHLLKGLDPIGVPKSLRNTVHTFAYNDFDELERVVKKFESLTEREIRNCKRVIKETFVD